MPPIATVRYAITKVAGMMACRRYRKGKGVFVSAGILYNHESPLRNEKFVTRKIAIAAARIARSGTGSIALGDPDAKVDWGYAPDYVDAMHRILCHATPDEYVVATGEVHSVDEFAEIAFRIVGLNYQDHVSTQSRLLQRKKTTFGLAISRGFDEILVGLPKSILKSWCAEW